MENRAVVREAEEISLEITGINHSGEGVGRCRGLAVFVPGAAPGERVRARVEEIRRNYARARLLEVTGPSPARRDPPCASFLDCGGCRLQHVGYREQIRLKTGLVRDSLARIAGLGSVPVAEAAGMENPWHYRNKARFQVEERPGGIVLGFYREGSHTLAAFAGAGGGCLLVDREISEAAAVIETLLNRHTPAPGRRSGGIFFRQVVVRKAVATGQLMAVLVTGPGEWPGEKAFALELTSLLPRIASLVRSVSPGASGPAPGWENRVLAGREQITERLGDLSFLISPSSFFQVNPAQALVLYRKAVEYAGTGSPAPAVLDAYSGVGAVALFMAGRAKKVWGLEENPGAVEDARRNAALNGIENAEFIRGKVEKTLPEMAAGGIKPDLVVLDPPRSGCRPEVLEAVAVMGSPRVVYISCDPGTLARDLGRLARLGYLVDEVQPVDMFPWTHHVEICTLLSKE